MSLVVSLEEIFEKETGLLAKHDSWERIELGKVCKILNGFPFKSTLFNKLEGFPVIRIRDIANSSTGTFYNGEFPSEYVVKKDDLLIGMDGNFRCCEWRGVDAGLNQRVCKITPDENFLHRQFLFYGLNGYLKAIEDVTSSVTVGHLSSRDIQQIPFPLPPFAEQRRIVAKLEKLLGQVDACRQRLEKMSTLLKRFRQSILAAACSGRLTVDWRKENGKSLEDNWHKAKLSEFIESSFYGPRFGKEDYSSEGIPTIRTTDIAFDGSIVLTDAPRIKLSLDQIDKYRLLHGDLVVTRTGATIGKCALYDESRGPAIPSAYLIRFRFKQDLVDPRYILRIFMSPVGQSFLASGSNAVAQPNINATTISQFLIPIPPLAEQQEIVRRVESLLALADQLELRLTQARSQVEKLTPSLLARAFAGKLVPQDSADEPASVLLARHRQPRLTFGVEDYFAQLIPALMRAAGGTLSLEKLNATVALLFVSKILKPLTASLGDAKIIAHFDRFNQPLKESAFATMLRLLTENKIVTSNPKNGMLQLNESEAPPINAVIAEDARYLATVMDLTPAKSLQSIIRKLCPKELREELMSTP